MRTHNRGLYEELTVYLSLFINYIICSLLTSLLLFFQTPRFEALSLLGSLTCFPNHYKDIPTLHSDFERHTMSTEAFKDHLMSLLLVAGKKEPAGLAR